MSPYVYDLGFLGSRIHTWSALLLNVTSSLIFFSFCRSFSFSTMDHAMFRLPTKPHMCTILNLNNCWSFFFSYTLYLRPDSGDYFILFSFLLFITIRRLWSRWKILRVMDSNGFTITTLWDIQLRQRHPLKPFPPVRILEIALSSSNRTQSTAISRNNFESQPIDQHRISIDDSHRFNHFIHIHIL